MEASPIRTDLALRRRRTARRAFLILGGVAVLAVGGYLGYRLLTDGDVDTDDAVVEADVVPLSVRVGGVVRQVAIRDHERVKKGDLLLEIDPTEYQAHVDAAQTELTAAQAASDAAEAQVRIVRASSSGGLSSARAQLGGAGAGVATARARIAAANAAISRAEADAHKAAAALERTSHLFARGAATQQELERDQAADAAGRAAVADARAQLAAAREEERAARSEVADARGRVEQTAPVDAQVAAADAQARMARAHVASVRAALQDARAQLSYTRLVAPIDGVASELAVRAGQNVSPGQVALALVPTTTYVIAHFKETDVARIQPGQAVDIDVDALPGQTLGGVVMSLSPATDSRFSLVPPDDGTGNFVKVVKRLAVKIAWTGSPPERARPGMSAEVTVHVD